MCTVTFFPTESGYVVAMNRDDLFTRAQTLPPSLVIAGKRSAIFPAEITGGTWIGTNDAGLTFCLLNWNHAAGVKLRSRGEVIRNVLASSSVRDVGGLLRADVLRGLLPFRLIAFSLHENAVREWRWDGLAISEPLMFGWQLNHWFSSGLSDDEARRNRLSVCEEALSRPNARTVDWLRCLHRSHAPERGPFSICAHRSEAGTLSYTEIAVSRDVTMINYSDASPCLTKPFHTTMLPHTTLGSPRL